MAINSKLKCLLFTALFLYGLSATQAQTAGYFQDPNTGRFTQRLSWIGGAYSLYFDVIIEKEENGNYAQYRNESTNDNFLEISLPPGNYRYRVITYDVLGKPGTGTQWVPLVVFNAIKPEIYQPEDDLNYYNDKQGSKFEFSGKDIEPDAKVYFVNSEEEKILPAETYIYEDGSGVSLVFDKGQLVDGTYDVFIENPGGLETSLGDVEFRTYKEKFGALHYTIGFSYMPVFNLFGEENNSFGDITCLSARLGITACIVSNKYFGVDFSFTRFMNKDKGINNVSDGFLFGFNFIFTNWLPERIGAVNFRMGVGYDTLVNELNTPNVGVFFQYHIFKYLNIEAGVDFIFTSGKNSGNILPWAGLSLLF